MVITLILNQDKLISSLIKLLIEIRIWLLTLIELLLDSLALGLNLFILFGQLLLLGNH
jgi:hypothetical protein